MAWGWKGDEGFAKELLRLVPSQRAGSAAARTAEARAQDGHGPSHCCRISSAVLS